MYLSISYPHLTEVRYQAPDQYLQLKLSGTFLSINAVI